MREVRVESWNELIDTLYADSWQPIIGRYRSRFVFRGVSNAAHSTLKTSLMRLGGPYSQTEGYLLRNFRKYALPELLSTTPSNSTWDWLAIAQHHGLPTRLLDWTYSPFVAMHFATSEIERFDVDGLIWCVDYVESQGFLPARLRRILDEEGATVFTADMLDRAAPTLAAFDALGANGAEARPFVAFFEPPSLDDRIVNQYALFSLMSGATFRLDHWLRERPDLLRKVIVPAGLKWEIRDKLDQANITERVLFPGLDGLSSWLRRYYSSSSSGQPDDEEDLAGAQSTAKPVPTQ